MIPISSRSWQGSGAAEKSVKLAQIKSEVIKSGVTDENHIIEINFEDVRYSKLTSYIKLNQYILNKIIDQNKYYRFLNEIQHVRQSEKVLASLKAAQNVSIFVTGSNSKLLSDRPAPLQIRSHLPLCWKTSFTMNWHTADMMWQSAKPIKVRSTS